MSAPVLTDNLLSRLADLESRLSRLERPPAATGAIPSGQTVPAGQITAGTLAVGVLVPAANVQPGTFPAGGFTFSGVLTINSATASNVVSTGAGAGYEFRERDNNANQWVWYGQGATARLWRGGYGDRLTVYTDRPSLNLGDRNFIGYPGAYGGNYAQFGHWNYRDDTNYGYMQSNVGMVFLSAPNEVHLRINNTDKWWLDWNAVNLVNCRMVLNSNRVDTRGYGDDWHTFQWWSGNDGLRITEFGGLYFRVRDQDPALEILATGVSRFRRFDQIGAYDTAAIMTKSEGGGTGAKVGFWSAGQNAAQILKCWGSTIEVRSWDDGGWGTLNGVLGNMSSEKIKRNVREATELLPRAKRRANLRKLRTVHYNRKPPERGWCANCLGTGKWSGRADRTEDERKAAGLARGFGYAFDDTCPDCGGDPWSVEPEAVKKSEEAGWLGFIAEEVAEEFPEAVFWRTPEDGGPPEPMALDTLALLSILWEEVRELGGFEDEARPKVADLESSGNAREERLNLLEARARSRIEALEAGDAANRARVGSVEAKAAGLDARTAEVDTKAGEATTKAVDAGTKAEGARARAAAAEARAQAAEARAQAAETKAAGVETKAGTLEQRVAANEAALATATTARSALEARLAAIEAIPSIAQALKPPKK